jgi:hypothetical protein
MHKNATKCNETLSKCCKNKHGASKIMDMLETYHRSSWILERLTDIMVDGPLLFTPKTTVLNFFISGCGIPIVVPHKNVVRLRHGLVVWSSVFPFATMGLSLGKLFFLSVPSSFPLTLTEHNLINKDTFFIWNKPTLALWYA